MLLKDALQGVIDEFWKVEGGQPSIKGWMQKYDIPEDRQFRVISLHVFIRDYAAFRINPTEFNEFVKRLLQLHNNRWRFNTHRQEWVRVAAS